MDRTVKIEILVFVLKIRAVAFTIATQMEEDIPQLVVDLPENEVIKTERVTTEPTSLMNLTTVSSTRKIPITIITGYLGSGKSTLLKRLEKNPTSD